MARAAQKNGNACVALVASVLRYGSNIFSKLNVDGGVKVVLKVCFG